MHITKYEGKRGTTWRARIDLPPDPITGKRRQKWISASTKREVERQARDLLHRMEHGGYTDGGKTALGTFLEKWLQDFGQPGWEAKTFTANAGLIRNHVTPEIGHIPLDKLSPPDLKRLYRMKLEGGRLDGKPGGLSARSVRYIHTLIHQALSHAVKWGLIVRNVADAVDPPKQRKPNMSVWNAEQLNEYLNRARGTHYYPVLAVAALTGMRMGEILGLRWQDVDFERGELTVQQALKDNQGQLYFGPPKTHRSRRPIALSQDAVAFLRAHKIRQNETRLLAGEVWENFDLVFCTATGNPIHPSNVSRHHRRVIREAGLPYIRIHDLRHTHATLLLADGAHVKVVSERLGHASTAFTMDVYSHVLPDMQREAADRLDLLVSLREVVDG